MDRRLTVAPSHGRVTFPNVRTIGEGDNVGVEIFDANGRKLLSGSTHLDEMGEWDAKFGDIRRDLIQR